MIGIDLHVHSNFSDGVDCPEDIVMSAISRGMKVLGFSDHSYTAFDEIPCIQKDKIKAYKQEINRLKAKYADTIEIRCGIEQDYCSVEPTDDYDYVIGSVHYLYKDGKYLCIDDTSEEFKRITEEHFGGDVYALTEAYWTCVADVVEKTNADIIGHFDLISKFNENKEFFDEHDKRYVRAWQKAADALLKYDIPFEINTGAISRRYKTQPYPSLEMIDYIKSKGGRFVLSGDSHQKEMLCYKFDEYEHLL
ncbi:MAG: histidinol-phosphatase [Eggerthellaceae bacterium]|nr:histidinol-phosphatase [Eggerthellaceae bacterium]